MSFELLYYRGAEKIFKKKKMTDDVMETLEYLDNVLIGAEKYGSLIKEGLHERGWRSSEDIRIIPGRKFHCRGLKRGIAVDGSLTCFEYAHEALFWMQIGFAYKKVDAGILLVNNIRGAKSPFGTTKELVESELELLEPLITLPILVVLFTLV